MALRKTSVAHGGELTAEYWRVNPVMSVNWEQGTARAELMLYENETVRRASGVLMQISKFEDGNVPFPILTLSGEEFRTAQGTGDLRAAIYQKLKTVPFFSDATDC